MRNNFAFDSVFLVVKCDFDKVGLGQGSKGARVVVNDGVVVMQLDAVEAQGGGGRAMTVFAGPEKEEEAKPGQVTDGKAMGGGGSSGNGVDVVEELDGNRFDADGSWVAVAPCFVKGGKAGVEDTKAVETGVRLPQAGERLCNVKDGIANCVSADRVATFGDGAGAVAVGEDLENLDFVGNKIKVGGQIEVRAEREPDVIPGVGNGDGAAGHDAGAGDCRNKAKVRAEVVADGRWHNCQGTVCG
jgi:hypothetical protein